MSNENLPYNAAVSGVGVADVIGLTTERTIQASFPDLFDKFLGTANNVNDVVDYSLLALLFAYGAGSEIVKYNRTQKDIETTKKIFLSYLDKTIKSSNALSISEKRNASEKKISEFAKKIFGDAFEVKLNWLADNSDQLVQNNPIVIIPKTDSKSATPKAKLIALIYEYLSSGLGTFWAMAGVFSFGYWVMFFLADVKGLASFSPEIAFTVPLTLPALYFGGKAYKKIKDKFLKYSANPEIITSELEAEKFAEKIKELQAEQQSLAIQNPISAPIISSALAEPVSFMRAFLMEQYHEKASKKIENKFNENVNLTDEDAANNEKIAKHPLAKILHLSKKLDLDLVLQQGEQKQPLIEQNGKISVTNTTANKGKNHLKEKFWAGKVGFVRKLVVALFSGAIAGYCGAQFAQWPIVDFLANVFQVAGAAAPLAGIITFGVAVGVGVIFGVKAAFAKYKELKRHNKKLALIDAPALEQNEQVEAQSAKKTRVTKLEYLEAEKTKILSSVVFKKDIKQKYKTALNNKAECESKINRIKSLPQQIKNLKREIRQLNYFVNNKTYLLLRPFLVFGRAVRFIFNRLQNKVSNETQEVVAQKYKLIKDANDLLEKKNGKLKALQTEYSEYEKAKALETLSTDLKEYQITITELEKHDQIKKYNAVAKLDAQIAAKKSKLTDIDRRRQAYCELNEKINRANSVREQVLRLETRSKVLSEEIIKQIDKATVLYKKSNAAGAQEAIKSLQELKVALKSKSFKAPSILTLDQIAEKKAVITLKKGVKSVFGKISGHLFDFIARAGTGGYLIRSGLMLLQALKVVLPIAASILALITPFTAPIILGGAFILGIGLFTMQKYLTYQQEKQQKIDTYLEDTQLMSIAADQQIETLNKAEEGLKKGNHYLTLLSAKLKDKVKSLSKPNPLKTKPTLGCLSLFGRVLNNFSEKHTQTDSSRAAASAQIAGYESAPKIMTQS